MKGRGQYDHPGAPAARRALPDVVRLERRAADAAELLLQQQLQIVQTKDHVMILIEMVHDVRMIRHGRRAPAEAAFARGWAIRSAGGKATRWWSRPPTSTRCSSSAARPRTSRSPSASRRTGADTILYKFTIDDPTTFTAPWSGEVPFNRTDELIYEYACHEGNYALSNVLSGERNREQREAEQKKTQQQD